MEALVRRAFHETVVQRLRRWDTEIMGLEHEFCAGEASRRAEVGCQIDKLVAKRTAANALLHELGVPPPEPGDPLQIPHLHRP